jgi:hypothetical protein
VDALEWIFELVGTVLELLFHLAHRRSRKRPPPPELIEGESLRLNPKVNPSLEKVRRDFPRDRW